MVAGLLRRRSRLRGLVGGLSPRLLRLLQSRLGSFPAPPWPEYRCASTASRACRAARPALHAPAAARRAATPAGSAAARPAPGPSAASNASRACATAAAGSSGRRFFSSRSRSRSSSCRSYSFSFSSWIAALAAAPPTRSRCRAASASMRFCVETRLSRDLLEGVVALRQFLGLFLPLLRQLFRLLVRLVDLVALLRDHLQARQHVAQLAQPVHVLFDGRRVAQQPLGLLPALAGVGEPLLQIDPLARLASSPQPFHVGPRLLPRLLGGVRCARRPPPVPAVRPRATPSRLLQDLQVASSVLRRSSAFLCSLS